MAELKPGIRVFQEERARHIEHGYTTEFDRNYKFGQLGYAARQLSNKDPDLISSVPPTGWQQAYWNKLRAKPFKDRLRMAGAFLAAYYDSEFLE